MAGIKDLNIESTQAIFTKHIESCRYVSCCLQLLLLCTEISFLNAKRFAFSICEYTAESREGTSLPSSL